MSNTHTTNETLLANKPYALMRDLAPVAPVNSSDLVMVVHPVGAGQDAAGVHRARQGAARQARLRLVRAGHALSHGRRAVQGHDRHRHPARAAQEQRRGAQRRDGRPRADDVRRRHRHEGQHRRAARCARSAPPATSARPCCPTCRPSSEAGVPGYEATIWLGIMAPKGTPKEIVDRLNAEIAKVIAKPAIRDAWAKQGAVPMTMTPAEFGAFLQERHRQVGEGRRAGRPQGAVKAAAHPEPAAPPRPGRAGAAGVRSCDRLHDRRHLRRRRRHARQAAGGRAGRPRDPEPRAGRRAGARAAMSWLVGQADVGAVRDRGRGAQRRSAARASATRPATGARRSRRPTRSISPIPALATAGIHFAKVMRELGVWEPRRRAGCGSRPTATRPCARSPPRRRAGRIGCTQETEILATPGIVVAAPLPPRLRPGDDLYLRCHRARRGARRGGVADRPADERRRPRCASTSGFQLIRGLPRLAARRQTRPQPPARREQTWPSSKPNVTGRCSSSA